MGTAKHFLPDDHENLASEVLCQMGGNDPSSQIPIDGVMASCMHRSEALFGVGRGNIIT